MIKFRSLVSVFAALALAASLVGPAHAGQVAVSFDTSQTWSLEGGSGTYGWQFTTQSDIEITSLGLYDSPGLLGGGFAGDGLIESHAIGIWDVSNPSEPLVSAIIPAGTQAPLTDGFRYVTTSPVMLSANHEYVIAAVYSSQDVINSDYMTGFNNNATFALTVGPGIEIEGYRYHLPAELVFPENYSPGLQFVPFGPNFTYQSVPEPSGLILGVIATMTLLCWSSLATWRHGGNRISRGSAC